MNAIPGKDKNKHDTLTIQILGKSKKKKKKVRRVTKTHFLGILLDVQLSSGQHIENIKGKKHASKKHTKNPQRIWMGCPCKHHADLLKVLHQG